MRTAEGVETFVTEACVAHPAASRQASAAQLADLVSLSARGEEDAFAELYDLTAVRIHGVVLRVLRSTTTPPRSPRKSSWKCGDAARYSPEKGSVMAWMTTMAHHRAVDRVRSVSSEASRDERYAAATADPAVDDVWAGVEERLDAERVRKGLASLTAIQREAITLAYFGGYSQSQVAQLLNLPLGTVKTRIPDGLIGLRGAFSCTGE